MEELIGGVYPEVETEMNEQEKSLKLAELMGWEVISVRDMRMYNPFCTGTADIELYNETTRGLAQFAAILLRFPEVMRRFDHVGPYGDGTGGIQTADGLPPTHTNILDEILRMNGVDVDE